jgi:nitroreductase
MLNSLKIKANVRMISEKEAKENFEYDHARFVAHSSAVRRNHAPEAILADVISVAHSLEKGLALASPRSGFGSEKVAYLLETLPLLENAGCSGLGVKNGRGVLECYVEFHDQRGLPRPENLETELRRFVKDGSKHEAVGGLTTLQRAQIADATNFDYDRFVRTRYSIRDFTGEPIAPEIVRRAVSQSIKSPRTRNREMRRVYTAYDPEVRKYLLSFQNGNRPFGEKAGAILVIATDMRQFDMIGERNQGWIDGGLFAMSLVYAFHAAGLGTCMLNWSASSAEDRRMREAFSIPDYDAVITMLAVGHLPESFNVAASPSPSADELMQTLMTTGPAKRAAQQMLHNP